MINVYNSINNNIVCIDKIKYDNPFIIGKRLNILNSKIEKLFMLCYKNKKCISIYLLSTGNENSSNVHYDDIINAFYLFDIDEFKIMHNHPSGNMNPSKDDYIVIKKCILLGNYYNVKFIDSIVLTKCGWYEILKERRIICREG